MMILGCRLEQTSGACPEQYGVYYGPVHIGYLRLRHGWFRADYPVGGARTVYEAHPQGEGCFEGHEREHYLTKAVQALLEAHRIDTEARVYD